MGRLTDYRGRMLNHVEVLYRPGDRELATRFLETLGCTVVDTGQENETGTTYLYAFPDTEEQDQR